MPQVTVYIRKEDLPLWKNLQNKSQEISDFLNQKKSLAKANTGEWAKVSNGVSSNGRTSAFGAENLGSSPSVPTKCCSLKTPCKHWKYEGQEGYWYNELSGEIREI